MSDDVVVAEPGDTVLVTEGESSEAEPETVISDVEGDAIDSDVEIEDHSFNTDTDESVNVSVNVEAPESGNDDTTNNLLREISSKLDNIAAATTVSAITDIEESNEPDTTVVAEPETTEVVTTDDGPTDLKDVKTDEEKTEPPKPRRRFGR